MITSTTFAEMQYKTLCWKEDKDCSVKAIAILLDISYAEAWYLCRKHGRKFQMGFNIPDIFKVIRSQDKDLININYVGSTVRFMQVYPTGSYLFELPNHIIAYKGGVLHDDTLNWIDPGSALYNIFHLMDKQDE